VSAAPIGNWLSLSIQWGIIYPYQLGYQAVASAVYSRCDRYVQPFGDFLSCS
jgi:hypothetical protein